MHDTSHILYEWENFTEVEIAGRVHRYSTGYRSLIIHRASDLAQFHYDIIINGVRCGFYKADFRYIGADGQTHIEDVKGVRTSVYALKKRIVEAMYHIEIEEV